MQLYWSLRERFKMATVSGLDDEVSITQLASIPYEINPHGQVQIESKEEARKRGVKSPDRAEVAFAGRTPEILRYYQERAEAQAEPEKNAEMAELDPIADDLVNIYEETLARIEKERGKTLSARYRTESPKPAWINLRQPVIARFDVTRHPTAG